MATGHGGPRPGAGRKPGKVSKAKLDIAEKAKTHGAAALAVLYEVMKRETVRGYILSHYINERPEVAFDLIDGKADLSTLKFAEDAL